MRKGAAVVSLGSRQMRVREAERAFLKDEYGDLPEPSAVAALVREYKMLRELVRKPRSKEFWK